MLKCFGNRIVNHGRRCFATTAKTTTTKTPVLNSFSISTTAQGMKTISTVDDFQVISDEPVHLGGSNEGPTPLQHVLCALASCESATAQFYLNVSKSIKIKVEKIDFELTGFMDNKARFQKIEGFCNVVTDGTDEQVKDLGHRVHIRCPVAIMMTNAGIELNIEWKKAE